MRAPLDFVAFRDSLWQLPNASRSKCDMPALPAMSVSIKDAGAEVVVFLLRLRGPTRGRL
jgi:hypothetical protein